MYMKMGGQGQVQQATDTQLDRQIVLKGFSGP